ncbi:prepilin-type N-terminal cleavage/methylation domain-containing protein [Geovibrio thiophilus]|uniref:Prepilin-type N-terminal cleavage/methylation domain-containing protein n=1 Tax=Geovibrio thiophilus TaxID=139438 RepID=A0A410K1B9_9BACT|nr:prepilin-type N-terminal cleavage/methylation domain-containing protein [Geovibrio thiophilus]QAR34246.1 prepilin-type N-terminal cleavage/methylation domain-containing protein [Geovibrio thiophilus]
MSARGFTLVEIIIVLLIIGIGFMTVVPVMVEKTTGEPEETAFLNDLLRKTADEAAELSRALPIRGVKGSDTLFLHDGETVKIPGISGVLSAEINDEEQSGLDYVIMVYPKGICDYFLLKVSDTETIESIPLLLQTRLK